MTVLNVSAPCPKPRLLVERRLRVAQTTVRFASVYGRISSFAGTGELEGGRWMLAYGGAGVDARDLADESWLDNGEELYAIWRGARDEAVLSYRWWCASPGPETYAIYRAAADREERAAAVVMDRAPLGRVVPGSPGRADRPE
jgi:hypothetical protein